MGYERLIRQADEIPFEGWDFGVFRGRFVEAAHACYGKVQQLKATEKAAASQKPARQPSA